MHLKKALAIVVMLCTLFTLAVPASTAQLWWIKGRYLRADVGDLPYAVFDNNGEELWLVCGETTTEFLDGLKLQKDVVVTYEVKKQFIEGAGEEVEIQQVQSVFIPSGFDPGFGVYIIEGQAPK